MKILDVKINWWLGCENEPSFQVLLDKTPREEPIFDVKYDGEIMLLFSNQDGFILFMARKKDLTIYEQGYGGATFNVKIRENGEIKPITFRGAWSSRSGQMNKYFTPQCIEVQFTNDPTAFHENYFKHGHIDQKMVIEAVERCLPEVQLINSNTNGGEQYLRPKLKSVKNPCKRCKGFMKYPKRYGNHEIVTCDRCNGTGKLNNGNGKHVEKCSKDTRGSYEQSII